MANPKKGLGTGLGALLGEDAIPEKTSGGAVMLPLTKVEPRQDQPRSQFDEAALQELSDSIAQYGVIQPITVRRLDSGYYQIIAGSAVGVPRGWLVSQKYPSALLRQMTVAPLNWPLWKICRGKI